PTGGVVLEKRFEVFGQRWRATRIAQFVNDHRSLGWLVQESLGDPRMAVDARQINRSNAAACGGRDREPPILPTWRKQLHRVSNSNIKNCCEPVAHDHRIWFVAKVLEASVLNLFRQVRRLKMK